MWSWIKTNASALEAIGVVLTALVALVALVGVKYQVDATAKLQQAQTAREICRGDYGVPLKSWAETSD